MKITVAENAGFCFGVKRATDRLEKALFEALPGERVLTLGHLIHNETYNKSLEERGVRSVNLSELEAFLSDVSESRPVTLLVRAHGCTAETVDTLNRLSSEHTGFSWIDCTCPFVAKIHRIAEDAGREGRFFGLMGAAEHPEVIGIMSCCKGEKAVFASPEELQTVILQRVDSKLDKKDPVFASQTTYNLCSWNKSQKIIENLYTKPKIFDTICSVTELRQTEAQRLSSVCDSIVVIGGRESSNTAKLFDICKQNCPNTVWIANSGELNLSLFSASHHVGIVAGASTPSSEIQEVYKTMSEMENFEELLESQCATIKTGDVVTGTVVYVSDAEIQLDLGTSVTGYIKAEQITDDPGFKLTENFKKGDKVEAFVIRVSDIEGMAELSKKRVDSEKNWKSIVDACENKTVLEGKVAEAVKGGVVIFSNSNRIFVPASHTGVPKDGDLSTLVGTTVQFKVIEIKQPGKKAIGSLRAVQRDLRRAAEADFWANIEVGKVYNGVVKSTTSYGAFVDLGGVDGMVHLTELSWKHIKRPEDVVTIGQNLTVFVKSFDPETKRISLGYKTEESNPWNIFRSQFTVGDIASVKIVSLMPFGAFAEIVDGVDGLIHISQISLQRIGKPAEVLAIGQVVDARIIEIDDEKQKVSLSIRSLLEEAAANAEAMPEEYVAEDAPADNQ